MTGLCENCSQITETHIVLFVKEHILIDPYEVNICKPCALERGISSCEWETGQ